MGRLQKCWALIYGSPWYWAFMYGSPINPINLLGFSTRARRRPKLAMTISSLRFPPCPWLPKSPSHTFRISIPIIPFRRPLIYCSSFSSSTTEHVATQSEKWGPFRKKKIVMRVGYVGSDYRGSFCACFTAISIKPNCYVACSQSMFSSFWFWFFLFFVLGLQMQRDEHSLSSKFIHSMALKSLCF